MKITPTRKYERELKKTLKTGISNTKIEDTLKLFLKDPTHNSLNLKKIKGCSNYTNLHQIRITSDFRILFEVHENEIILVHIGKHNYIEKRTADC